MSPSFNGRENEEPRASEHSINYLDGSVLLRPLSIPRSQIFIMITLIAVAVVIGGFLLFRVLDSTIYAAERQQADMGEVLDAEVSYSLPRLAELVSHDDATIREIFAEEGLEIIERDTTDDGVPQGFNIVRVPDTMTREEALLISTQLKGSPDPVQAVRLLNGAWWMTITREGSTILKINYADLKNSGQDAAVLKALDDEGLREYAEAAAQKVAEENEQPVKTVEESIDTDESGNRYLSGTIKVGDTTYEWKVAACELSEIYSVDGLSNAASYVGITFTKN